MTKEEIISFLPSTYCRIKTSKIHGVGVHAIVPITQGTNLFPDCSTNLKDIKKISKKEVSHIDDEVKKMMSDFLIESKTHYFMISSLNNINISYFLNHSDNPNCIWKEENDCFYSLKDLKVGEELTLDYEDYLVSDLVLDKMIDLNHKHLILKGSMDKVLNVEEVKNIINDLVDKLDMKYVKTMPVNPMVAYEPNENRGVTGVGIITTSHIIIHTWDDTKYFQADIYSCKDFNPYQVINLLKLHRLKSKKGKLLDRNEKIKDLNLVIFS